MPPAPALTPGRSPLNLSQLILPSACEDVLMSKETQSSKKMRELLGRSLKESRPVSIQRAVEQDEILDGIVLAFNSRWVLIASVRDGGYLDGYKVLRLADLRRVNSTPFEGFLRQGAGWPPKKPLASFDLRDPRSIMQTAAGESPIVTVFREVKRPATCLIGAPVDWGKKSVWLLPINPEANWEDFMTKIRFKDVTQVAFGGDYERALLYVAGDIPPRTKSK